MKWKEACGYWGIGMAVLAAAGCEGNSPNQPQTLDQQREMAKGRAPTSEELAKAMAKLKTPGKEVQPPPGQKTP